jgi:hypothetical protein
MYFEGKINMKVVEELKLDFPDIDFAIPSKSEYSNPKIHSYK